MAPYIVVLITGLLLSLVPLFLKGNVGLAVGGVGIVVGLTGVALLAMNIAK